MFLTRDQLRQLCGTTDRRRQIEVLRRERIRHTVDWRGRPVVPVSAIDGTPPVAGEQQVTWTPRVLVG